MLRSKDLVVNPIESISFETRRRWGRRIHLDGLGVVILAGGRGERMGRDKGLLDLCGKPLLLHVVERALELKPDEVVIVVGRGGLDRYASIIPSGVTLSEDVVEDGGPLAGMVSGMMGIDSEHTLVLPCDTPFVKLDVLRLLYKRVGGGDAVIPRWPNGYIEPLQALYRTSSALRAGEEALHGDESSCRDMIRRLNRVVYINTDEIRGVDPHLVTFFNINIIEDLLRAEKFIRGVIPNPYQNR